MVCFYCIKVLYLTYPPQLNKCLSENQKLWKDRVGVLEKKIDVTIQQKEQVIYCSQKLYFMCTLHNSFSTVTVIANFLQKLCPYIQSLK